MTVADRPAFAEFMLGLGEAYGESVSEGRMEIYFAALGDLALEDIRQAATVHVRSQKFFPRVAELREAIQGSADDHAELAWMDVMTQVRTRGYNRTPTLDSVSLQVIQALFGGWVALCSTLPASGPELLGMAKQFKAAYGVYTKRAELPALDGIDFKRLVGHD